MNRTHSIVLGLALLLPTAALAQPLPGVTTKADVLAMMGEPDMTFQADALFGDVELLPAPGSPGTVDRVFARARKDPHGRKPALYDVLQYWDGPSGTSRSSFVFPEGGDRLLYAVVKPSPSEATLDKAIARYGRRPEIRTVEYEYGHLVLVAFHLVFAEDGVELVVDNRAGKVTRKLLVHRDENGLASMPPAR